VADLTAERAVVEEVPVEELAAIARYAKTKRAMDGNFIPLRKQTKSSSTHGVPVDRDPFSQQELATLKELRRLRSKVFGK
jgi:hypothetical protein